MEEKEELSFDKAVVIALGYCAVILAGKVIEAVNEYVGDDKKIGE